MNETKLVPNAVVIDDFVNRRSKTENDDLAYNYGQMRYKCKASGKLITIAEWHLNEVQMYNTIYPTAKKVLTALHDALIAANVTIKPTKDTRY